MGFAFLVFEKGIQIMDYNRIMIYSINTLKQQLFLHVLEGPAGLQTFTNYSWREQGESPRNGALANHLLSNPNCRSLVF